MQARSTASVNLSALPWDSPLSSKRNATGIDKHRAKTNSLWSSAPNLDFNPDWREDDDAFETFDEQAFSKSFHNLSFDVNFDDIDDDDNLKTNPFRQDSPTRVKVKSGRDSEITDLFSKWKTGQKKPTVENWPSEFVKSPTKDKTATSPVKCIATCGLHAESSSPNDLSLVDASIGSSPTRTSSPKRKKKIAVKLKASDLNLSAEKQKEIEQMFWKLKQNPQTKNQSKKNSDQRWSDMQTQNSMKRPKPVTRQLSIEDDEIDFDRPRPVSPEKIKPLLPSRSDTISGSSARIVERRNSRDRERSRSRHPENRRTSKSKSRSPSSTRSKSREPRSSSRGESKERSSRTRSTSRGPSSESKSSRLRRQTSVDSAESCSNGRSRSRPRRTASRSRRIRSASQGGKLSSSQTRTRTASHLPVDQTT